MVGTEQLKIPLVMFAAGAGGGTQEQVGQEAKSPGLAEKPFTCVKVTEAPLMVPIKNPLAKLFLT